jgi:hypothetical protein
MYQKAIPLITDNEPMKAYIYHYLGKIRFKQNNLEEAQAYFDEAEKRGLPSPIKIIKNKE